MKNINLDIITDAINKQLNEQAVQEIKQNMELAEEILFAKEMHFVNRHKTQIQVQETLKNILTDLTVTPDNTLTNTLIKEEEIQLQDIRSGSNKLWWLGGSLLLILTLTALFWMRPAGNKMTGIQQNTLEILMPLNAFTGYNVNQEKDDYSLGFEAYDKGNYALSVTYLGNYIDNYPNDEQVRLYLSINHLFIENYQESLVNLQLLSSSKSEFIKDHLDWYTGIAHLMNLETEIGVRKLQSIPPDNIHFEDAEILLSQIINQ